MNEYHVKSIRNVAVLGHLGSGKTSFIEAMLCASKAIEKKGEVERKNTVCDYAVEEQTRQTTLTTKLAPVEWKGFKINFFDTPGSEEMVGELDNALSVADLAIVLVDALKGVEVGTERCWVELRKRNIPTMIFVNKMDKENIKYDAMIDAVVERLGKNVVPFAYPIGADANFKGIACIPEKKAYTYQAGKETVADASDAELGNVAGNYDALCEKAAETSEEIMEKYFGGEELTLEELNTAIHASVASCELFPLICGSALKDVCLGKLLDMICAYGPAADEEKELVVKSGELKVSDDAPLVAYAFKTIIDPFVGTITMLKVLSGKIATGMDAYIPNTDTVVKLPQLFVMMGKTQINVDQAWCGDIVCVGKLTELQIGFSLCEKKSPVEFNLPEYPSPIYYLAVNPKNKSDEEKISSALQKISLEDLTFEYRRTPETNQLLIGGQGKLHLDFVKDKLKNTFKVEVTEEDPKIVYRETIRGRTMGEKGVQGKHKKQNGGGGQYGDVWIKFSPIDRNNPEEADKDFIFAEEIFGGSVPKNYFPAVEKGLIQALEKGPLAGFPVVGVKAVLVDGSYHPVDSNEISFVQAAKLAWGNAINEVKPTILEPIMEIYVTVKADYVGDIMSDMSKRRGRIVGQDEVGNGFIKITAIVPEAEIIKYAIDLKTMTQASGSFERKFIKYDITPDDKIKKIVEEYKQN